MDDSIAQARLGTGPLELPAWKTMLCTAAACLLGLLFIVSGVWKLIEPFEWAARVVQAKVPAPLGLPAALGVGIAETFGGALLLVPRFRRWGALITGFLLIVFMAYFAWFYKELTGADCSCFPWLKRTVGPGFFIGDGAMLLLAVIAWVWARKSESLRGALIILGVISVFAASSLGIAYARQSGAPAPESIAVNGQPYPLEFGRHFIYFFDPECAHCFQAAKAMARYRWKETSVIAVPTVNPQFADNFLKETGLTNARLSSDAAKLKAAFPFGDPPFAVLVENGRQKATFRAFEGSEPENTLRSLGSVE
jgi:uncharacterized membrane protein YphA (DoxX/SURF4 family)